MSVSKDNESDLVSLKDLILGVREYLLYLWNKKWWIILVAILGAAFFVFRIYDRPGQYSGSLIVSINTPNQGSSLGGVGSLLGQIGLGGSGENSLIKARALGQTYEVITKSLLDSITVMDKRDLIANHIIQHHNFDEELFPDMSEAMQGFRFKHTRRDEFDRYELRMLKYLYNYVGSLQSGLLEASQEEETGRISFELTTHAAELTAGLLDRLYINLRKTYVQQSIAPQKRTLDELKVRADSIEKRIATVEYQLSAMQDRTMGLTSSRQLVEQAKLQREANLLNSTYIEVLRNIESADFILKTAKPDLQIVQAPVFPLDYSGNNYLVSAIFGAVFGGFLSILGFSLLKTYRKVMDTETSENE